VALLAATIYEPLYYIFTNYNVVEAQDYDQGHCLIRPTDGYGNIRL
jgi:hypothetical protein